MSQSTPLDQLDDSGPMTAPPGDEERVKKIIAEMNAGDIVQQPPSGLAAMPRVISEPPITMSTGQLRMDADAARAHMIGGATPTMADFQAMLNQTAPGMAPFHGTAAMQPSMQSYRAPKSSTGSWKSYLAAQIRGPVAVAIIMFLLSLPIVTNILSRYASWMYLSSGEISMAGLFVKALLAGALFAAYQGINAVFEK